MSNHSTSVTRAIKYWSNWPKWKQTMFNKTKGRMDKWKQTML